VSTVQYSFCCISLAYCRSSVPSSCKELWIWLPKSLAFWHGELFQWLLFWSSVTWYKCCMVGCIPVVLLFCQNRDIECATHTARLCCISFEMFSDYMQSVLYCWSLSHLLSLHITGCVMSCIWCVRVARWSYLKYQTRHRYAECVEGEGNWEGISSRLGGLGECRSSPIGVWGGAPAESINDFNALCTRKTAYGE